MLLCIFYHCHIKLLYYTPWECIRLSRYFTERWPKKKSITTNFFVTFIALWKPSRSKMEKDVEKCLQKKYLSLFVLASKVRILEICSSIPMISMLKCTLYHCHIKLLYFTPRECRWLNKYFTERWSQKINPLLRILCYFCCWKETIQKVAKDVEKCEHKK